MHTLREKGDLELYANVFIIGTAVLFTLWQGVGFAVTLEIGRAHV